jgi:hypothetical protein
VKLHLADIFDGLEEVLPILGTMSGHPEIAQLAARLLDMGQDELKRRRSVTGRTRAEILADAKATFAQFKKENDELKQLGHA